jgi:hypothetical protein
MLLGWKMILIIMLALGLALLVFALWHTLKIIRHQLNQ